MPEVIVEELWIKEKNKEIYGKLYLPQGEDVFPAIILSHGYNGCNEDFVNECMFYAQNGIIAYAYDFCGGSTRAKSKGDSTHMTIFTEKEDLRIVFEYIKKMKQVDSDQIYLFGGSQGGLVTALTAEEYKDELKGMILYYPAFNIPDDWRKNYPKESDIPKEIEFWGLRLGDIFFKAIREFNTFENIGTFDKKVLIIHGNQDEVVSMNYVEEGIKQYEKAKLVVLEGEGHGFTLEGGRKAMELVLQFIKGAE